MHPVKRASPMMLENRSELLFLWDVTARDTIYGLVDVPFREGIDRKMQTRNGGSFLLFYATVPMYVATLLCKELLVKGTISISTAK